MNCFIFFIFWSVTLINVTKGQVRISNGRPALDGEFPYQALIFDNKTYCSGSIIHKRWILTAGHCQYKSRKNIGVYVGTNKNLGKSGKRYSVERIVRHERLVIKPNYVRNDIALIRVTSEIQFNHRVQPVRLADDDLNRFENHWAVVSGWGKLRPSNPTTYLPRTLQYIKVQVIGQKSCRRSWPNLSETNICTAVVNGRATCQGDSGAPLVVGDMQIGLVSHSDGECGNAAPTVYTRISSFYPWISSQINSYFETL